MKVFIFCLPWLLLSEAGSANDYDVEYTYKVIMEKNGSVEIDIPVIIRDSDEVVGRVPGKVDSTVYREENLKSKAPLSNKYDRRGLINFLHEKANTLCGRPFPSPSEIVFRGASYGLRKRFTVSLPPESFDLDIKKLEIHGSVLPDYTASTGVIEVVCN